MNVSEATDILIQAALNDAIKGHEQNLNNGSYDRWYTQRGYPVPEAPTVDDFVGRYDNPQWGEIAEHCGGKEPITVEHNDVTHTVQEMEQHGGEGEGDQYWHVYKIDDQYFKLSAYYASWDGVFWEDAELWEVKPKEVVKIQWVKVTSR